MYLFKPPQNPLQFPWLTKLELLKIRRQKSGLAGIIVVVMMVGFSAMGFYLRRVKKGEKHFDGKLIAELLNGITFADCVLVPVVYMLLPILVGIITASCFAGEFQSGHMRNICSRPVLRRNILMAKWVTMTLYSLFLLGVLLLIGYVAGALLFGASGDVLIYGELFLGKRSLHVIPEAIAWRRMIAAYAMAGLSLSYIVAMFLMFSAIIKRMPNAALIPLGVYFTSYILMNLPFMERLRPFLPTRYLAVWRYFFYKNVPWDLVGHDSLIISAYIVGFLVVGCFFFNSSDV